MDETMKTTDGQSGDNAGEAEARGDSGGRPPSDPEAAGLVAVASRPGVDPCDVACGAMPALVLHDLAASDDAWLLDHTADCRWCANELHRFRQTASVLDRLGARLGTVVAPTPTLPRRRRAGYARIESPLGPLLVASSETGLCEIDFAEHETEEAFRRRLAARGFDPRPLPEGCDVGEEWATLVDVAAQLREYFGRRRDRFDLPLDLAGVTPFTRSVLEATAGVPFGRLDTYQGIARAIGRPTATRAVGNALGRNPIPVVVPCHRVVRSGGTLGGYTGGLEIKRQLLALEGTMLA